jgi:hypothetical protein
MNQLSLHHFNIWRENILSIGQRDFRFECFFAVETTSVDEGLVVRVAGGEDNHICRETFIFFYVEQISHYDVTPKNAFLYIFLLRIQN